MKTLNIVCTISWLSLAFATSYAQSPTLNWTFIVITFTAIAIAIKRQITTKDGTKRDPLHTP